MIDTTPEPAHALLGASSAHRWLECTPSARLNAQFPDEQSPYAAEGSAAHALAEARLRWLLKQSDMERYHAEIAAAKTTYAAYIKDWGQSDWDAIDAYVNHVLELVESYGGAGKVRVLIEQRVNYSHWVPGGFGTGDVVILAPHAIHVVDLKFGSGIKVEADGNPQLRLYALGALALHPDATDISWTIAQPRIVGGFSSAATTREELVAWANDYVRPRGLLADRGEGEFRPSAEACQFCKARAVCKPRGEKVLADARDAFDEAKTVEQYTVEDFADILPKLGLIQSWLSDVKEHTLKITRDQGERIPGYKLVAGRSSRQWKDGAEEALKRSRQIKADEIYAPRTMRSVAQMEKTLGRKRYADLIEQYVNTAPGAPALVPDSDKRAEWSPVANAVADYGLDPQASGDNTGD